MNKPLKTTVDGLTNKLQTDSPGSKLSERTEHVRQAYLIHHLSFKEMRYALMQYEISQVDGAEVRDNHFVPAIPVKPPKNAEADELKKYYIACKTRRRAINLNYESKECIKKVAAFKKDMLDDDYNYSKAKEWGAYIVTGVISGTVHEYLGKPEEDIPF